MKWPQYKRSQPPNRTNSEGIAKMGKIIASRGRGALADRQPERYDAPSRFDDASAAPSLPVGPPPLIASPTWRTTTLVSFSLGPESFVGGRIVLSKELCCGNAFVCGQSEL